MYRPNFYESTCLRCNEIVYQVDRIGPLKDFTFFHSGCFKCIHCGTKLTLKTYFNNQHKQDDKEVSSTFYRLNSKKATGLIENRREIFRYVKYLFLVDLSILLQEI